MQVSAHKWIKQSRTDRFAATLGSVNLLLTISGELALTAGRSARPRQAGAGRLGDKTMNAMWNVRATQVFSPVSLEAEQDLLIANHLAAAAQGDLSAYFDLGVAYSTGSHGVPCDLIEAHKWFNLAAVKGHEEAQLCRADISDEMTAREVAEAQRRAREWMSATTRKAA
jgi:TPR repeat protein